MKRASYREAVAYAADLDNDVVHPDDMVGLITVNMIATIFDVETDKVVRDVIRARDSRQINKQPVELRA